MTEKMLQTWSDQDVSALAAPLSRLRSLLWPWLLRRPVHLVAARKPGDGLDPWLLPGGERHRFAHVPEPGLVGLNIITTVDQLEDPKPMLHWSIGAFRVLALPPDVRPFSGPCPRDRDDVRVVQMWTIPDAVVLAVKEAVMPWGGPAYIYATPGSMQVQFIGPSLEDCRRGYGAWLGRAPGNN